jgi:hypothetical protein
LNDFSIIRTKRNFTSKLNKNTSYISAGAIEKLQIPEYPEYKTPHW